MTIIKIPITTDFSIELNNLIGHLAIPKQIADAIAEMAARGLKLELVPCILNENGKYSLVNLSIAAIPVEKSLGWSETVKIEGGSMATKQELDDLGL